MNAVVMLKIVRKIYSYDPQTGVFLWRYGKRSGQVAGASNAAGYRLIRVSGRLHYAHRVAWLIATGVWSDKFIDHINGVRSDNRLLNLREATHSENMANARRRKGQAGLKGCHFHSGTGKWRAQIMVRRVRYDLGLFATQEAAHAAYAAAAYEKSGTFARVA